MGRCDRFYCIITARRFSKWGGFKERIRERKTAREEVYFHEQRCANYNASDGMIFLDLGDVIPEAYETGKYVRVNATGDGLIFDDVAGGVSTFVSLTDTPGAFVANKYLRVNVAANALEFVDVVGGSSVDVSDGTNLISATVIEFIDNLTISDQGGGTFPGTLGLIAIYDGINATPLLSITPESRMNWAMELKHCRSQVSMTSEARSIETVGISFDLNIRDGIVGITNEDQQNTNWWRVNMANKIEVALVCKDESDLASGHKRKKEGDVIAMVQYPWTWSTLERKRVLIVVVDNLQDEYYEELASASSSANDKRKYKMPFDIPRDGWYPSLDLDRVRDPNDEYQPLKDLSIVIDAAEEYSMFYNKDTSAYKYPIKKDIT